MSTEIIDLVKQNPYFELLENGKIRCKLTNHEMNPDVSKYNEYIKSKGYQKAIEKDFDFDQYKPHIVPFKKAEEHFLWCHLTQTKVPKMKNVILRHVEGKKYQRLLALFNQKKQEREQKKKITLLKSKKLTTEEEEDKFDENFIDRMINEFEEDERLNDQDLDGEESYSNDLYQKVHANNIHEQEEKQAKNGKQQKQQGKNQKRNDEEIDDEDIDEEEEDIEDLEDDEELDSENEGLDEDEDDQEEEEDNQVDEEEIPDSKQTQKENNQKQGNKFQNNSKKFNGNNHNNHQNKQGVNKFIKKNKNNNFNKFKHNNHNNKKKFQKQ